MQLTVTDAARLLRTSEERIYAWIDARSIPHDEVNEQFRFNRAELLEWATARMMRVSPELFESPPCLVDALRAGGVHLDLPNVHDVVARLPIRDELDRALVAEVFDARKRVAVHAGDGIGIPSVREPIVLPGTGAAIVVAHLASPIELDGHAITTVIAMLTPTPKSHLQLLSRLSAALHDPAFKAALKRRANLDELLGEATRVEASFAVLPELGSSDLPAKVVE